MRQITRTILVLLFGSISAFPQPFRGENLSRGFIGVPIEHAMYFSWRMFVDDSQTLAFDLYRSVDGGPEIKLNKQPIILTSDFIDETVNFNADNRWILKIGDRVVGTCERKKGETKDPYLRVPIQKPEGGEIAGEQFVYTANDCSVGDLDGDGNYEIVLQWTPSNSKRPPQRGFTGNTYLDAYKLDGTRLWRIDLGPNIRSGAATTNFLVFDYDGDGRAELCCKTGDGTIDGIGHVIGDSKVDWRTWDKESPTYGKIVNGPEYLSVFEGSTGRVLDTKEYIPTRYPLDGWGGIGGNGGNDSTGGRSDRFTAGVAFLDGKTPSPVMVRGWYGRTVVAAWTFTNGKLKSLWTFDSATPGLEAYSGMGNHSLTVADFDGDGCDEVCVGAMTVDNNGKGLYTTGLRHGDALHASDLIPSRPGLEVFGVHENEGNDSIVQRTPAVAMFDGATGEIIWQDGLGLDAGRGVAADIDPRYEGAECWGGPGGLRRGDTGQFISSKKPNSCNFTIYWDADSLAELLDHTSISKWNWQTERTDLLLKAEGVVSNNGTKANPCLSGDILGDWREEVIWPSMDQMELRIYTTTIPANDRRPTLMSDRQYRLAIAWQNVGYNQPPHSSKH
ncbi:MAG: rhamnogalacturonan lyase [Bacteroidetes bacterium]|nr:rhamnogalacturonan lyase [Bacteroidota bacterium]